MNFLVSIWFLSITFLAGFMLGVVFTLLLGVRLSGFLEITPKEYVKKP